MRGSLRRRRRLLQRGHPLEIETSRDLNGNGRIDHDGRELLGQDDECILFTVDVGGINAVPRSLAIDADGDVWWGCTRSGGSSSSTRATARSFAASPSTSSPTARLFAIAAAASLPSLLFAQPMWRFDRAAAAALLAGSVALGSLGAGGLRLWGGDVASGIAALEAELDRPSRAVRCPGR